MNVSLWLEESKEGDSFGRSGLLVLPSASCGTSLSVYLLMRKLLNGCWRETEGEIRGERVSPVKVSGAEGSKLGQFPHGKASSPDALVSFYASNPEN